MGQAATPETGGYMVVAYVLTAILLAGYAVSLWRRGKPR
jgi:hypothetical protein